MLLSRWKKLHKMFDTFLKRSEQEFNSNDQVYVWYVSISKYELKFLIFCFFSNFRRAKKYLYLFDSNFFGCFGKLWIWIVHFWGFSPTGQDYDTSWDPILPGIFGKSPKCINIPSAPPYCKHQATHRRESLLNYLSPIIAQNDSWRISEYILA